MMIHVNIWILIQILIFHVQFGRCSRQVQALFKRKDGEYLATNVIRTEKADSEFDCTLLCSREMSCASVNYKKSGENRGMCELNNKTLQDSEESRRESPQFVHLWVIKRENLNFPEEKLISSVPFVAHSCLDYYKKGTRLNGYYKIYDNNRSELTVYCDMNSEPGAAWTLVESYAFKNLAHFKKAAFSSNAPVNEMSSNWDNYRMTHGYMTFIKTQSTHWRATCNFPTNDVVNYTDYVRANFASFDVMSFEGRGHVSYVEYINVRGYQCANCTSQWWQEDGTYHFHTDSYFTNDCSFSTKGAVVLQGKGEDNFGYYATANPKFSCTSSPDSTTNVWFGGYND